MVKKRSGTADFAILIVLEKQVGGRNLLPDGSSFKILIAEGRSSY